MKARLLEPTTVRFERVLPGPVERVWAYLTESDKRAQWFAGGEFELKVGGRIELIWDHDRISSDRNTPESHKNTKGSRSEGRITKLEPNRLLAYTWTMGGVEGEATFELETRGKDVLLTVTHARLPNRDRTIAVAGGWDVHTGILADILNGVERRPFWTTHAQVHKEYAATL